MTKLITDNPELLIYIDGKIHITVLGGIKLTGLDRLKVAYSTYMKVRSDLLEADASYLEYFEKAEGHAEDVYKNLSK